MAGLYGNNVLCSNQVAEQGTHEKLVDSDGIYMELWSAREMAIIEGEPEEEGKGGKEVKEVKKA